MPYIAKHRRKDLDELPLKEAGHKCMSVGELCYCIYMLMIQYARENGRSFTIFSSCTTAARHAIAEFDRKIVNPYEDEKIHENGDIRL